MMKVYSVIWQEKDSYLSDIDITFASLEDAKKRLREMKKCEPGLCWYIREQRVIGGMFDV